MKLKFFKVTSCPILGKSGSAYRALVVLPSAATLFLLLLLLLYSYTAEVASLNAFHRSRLSDLVSHMVATVDQKDDLQQLSKRLELYTRSTPQPEFFKLHLFLVEGNKISAGTDLAAVGRTLPAAAPVLKPFSFRRGEAITAMKLTVEQWIPHSFLGNLNFTAKRLLHLSARSTQHVRSKRYRCNFNPKTGVSMTFSVG